VRAHNQGEHSEALAGHYAGIKSNHRVSDTILMKISLNWIKEYVEGLHIIDKKSLRNVVVGYVDSMQKHSNADSLNVAQVNIGDKIVQIVCGGVNLRPNVHVLVALPGAVLPGNFAIQPSKIRGEESNGMICAKEELKLGTNPPHEIWILDEEKNWHSGAPILKAGTPLLEALHLENSYSAEEIQSLLTHHTAEVEGILHQDQNLDKVVTGKLLEFEKIAGSEKLHKGIFDIGWKKIQIVFGSVHVIHPGEILPIALPGAKLPGGEIKITEMMGVKSEGMVCGDDELGIGQKGLTRFPANTPLGQPIADILGLNDISLVVDNKSLTHRPDLWGHYGIAREIAAISDKKLKPLQLEIDFPATGESPNVEVKAKKLCPRYLGVYINNIKIAESPAWLKNRLSAVGYRSINNIVDVTNYVMAELGQPLHAFDAAKIDTGIIVRTAKKDEKITTLDGVERSLNQTGKDETLVIADHKKPVAIAGIMGGANSEVDQQTTKILVESANFQPSSVRLTSVKLGLRTEAVQRFEKSLDPNLAEQAMKRVCDLILQVSPEAIICGPVTDIKNFKDKQLTVTVSLKKVFSKIGVTIPTEEVLKNLNSLEFKTTLSGKDKIKVEIPSFRATKDISIEDDIVEEIARMHGYENIEAKLPKLPIKLPIENNERKLKHFARHALSLGLGFNEVYNYSFYSINDIKKCLLPEEPHIKVQNYLSEDQTHMRISLMPNILKNIGLNLKSFDQFKLYEIGRTYEDLQEYFPIEEKKICAVIVRNKAATKEKNTAAGASNQGPSEPFYEIKGALEEFFKLFHVNLKALEMRKGESLCAYAHPNRYASYYSRKSGQEIARIFELHPLVAKNYDIENAKIAVFEVNFSKLANLETEERKYKQIPKFPGIRIDVSVLIDKNTEIGKLQRAIQNCNKELIREVELFDLYEGQNIPPDKKALAFKVLLQSTQRTLTDAEMKTTQQKIFEELTKLGGEIRGLK